jgi:rhodanese-related sulfurtransferase
VSTCRGSPSSRRSSNPGDARVAAPPRPGIEGLLAQARRGLERLTAAQALSAVAGGAILVDTRSEDQRAAQGYVRAARHIPLSVLEWRLDPDSGYADEDVTLDSWIVLICREGYSSSLAAARLQTLGFERATDVIDGVDG